MCAPSMPFISARVLKRKCECADDAPSSPTDNPKRQCTTHVGRDGRPAQFGFGIAQPDRAVYAWVPRPGWQAQAQAGGSIAMQRIVRRTLQPAPLRVLPSAPEPSGCAPLAATVEAPAVAPDLVMSSGEVDDMERKFAPMPVRVRRTGPLVALPPYGA